MKIYLSAFVLVLISSNAFAYLDPGLGAMFTQALVGAIAGVLIFWQNLKTFLTNIFKRKNTISTKKNNDKKK